MNGPRWSQVDDNTADLLTLVADEGHVSADREWDIYLRALHSVAVRNGGVIYPNSLRPLVHGKVAPQRVGAFTRRALLEGVVVYTGDYQISDDTEGRNGGKPARVMRWIGGVPS